MPFLVNQRLRYILFPDGENVHFDSTTCGDIWTAGKENINKRRIFQFFEKNIDDNDSDEYHISCLKNVLKWIECRKEYFCWPYLCLISLYFKEFCMNYQKATESISFKMEYSSTDSIGLHTLAEMFNLGTSIHQWQTSFLINQPTHLMLVKDDDIRFDSTEACGNSVLVAFQGHQNIDIPSQSTTRIPIRFEKDESMVIIIKYIQLIISKTIE